MNDNHLAQLLLSSFKTRLSTAPTEVTIYMLPGQSLKHFSAEVSVATADPENSGKPAYFKFVRSRHSGNELTYAVIRQTTPTSADHVS